MQNPKKEKVKTNTTKKQFRGLGVSAIRSGIYSFVQDTSNPGDTFIIQKSADGRSFALKDVDARISSINLPLDTIESCSNFALAEHDEYYYLTYKTKKNGIAQLVLAQSSDMVAWEKMAVVTAGNQDEHISGCVVSNYTHKDHLMLYAGGSHLSLHGSNNLIDWYAEAPDLLGDRVSDGEDITIASIDVLNEGILVAYYTHTRQKKGAEISDTNGSTLNPQDYRLRAALFDKENPAKLLWHSEESLQTVDRNTQDTKDLGSPFGLVLRDDAFISYWQGVSGRLYLFYHVVSGSVLDEAKDGDRELWSREELPQLERVPENPIMAPKAEHAWESKAAFNPAAIFVDGAFHIIYRAIGENDVSVLGYARSEDGINISYRDEHPAYVPREIFEGALQPLNKVDHKNWSPYMSGGGAWGGCEDPRLNRIDDRIYLTYVAYNGWQPPRLAMAWITIENFLKRDWKWSKPVLISPPGVVSKSGSMLPEKIDGHYVFFHRVFPDIHIDFIDDLNRFDGRTFFLKCRSSIKVREDHWDAGKFSMGAPPMKTRDGWLVIYSAVSGRQEWEGSDLRYKIGAMLLDLKDPTKVIYRSHDAILKPEVHYENDGAKYGIIYPCGAVIKGEKLFVYYGGSDEFTCVGTANLDNFLSKLKTTGKIEESLTI